MRTQASPPEEVFFWKGIAEIGSDKSAIRCQVVQLFETKQLKAQKKAPELVAVACADGDLVTALCTAAIQDGSTGLGLHAGKKPVGLRAMAAVWLKSTLGHGNNSCF